jgi:hypothetical protein
LAGFLGKSTRGRPASSHPVNWPITRRFQSERELGAAVDPGLFFLAALSFASNLLLGAGLIKLSPRLSILMNLLALQRHILACFTDNLT